MTENIKKHNKKYSIGNIVQGAKILKILNYSKNGKSTNFLWECPICHQEFECNANPKNKKLCPKCLSQNIVMPKLSMNDTQCGIYTISCENYIYIGESINIKARWEQHQQDLQNKNHHNTKLQQLFNQNKELRYDIVECSNPINEYIVYFKLLNLKLENEYIQKYKNSENIVLNEEDTLSRIESIPQLKSLWDNFISTSLSQYADIPKYCNKDANNIMWKDFKEQFYSNSKNKIKLKSQIDFVQIPTIVINKIIKEHDAGALLVYSALILHRNLQTKECYLTIERLAKELEISISTVGRGIRTLKSIGVIKIVSGKFNKVNNAYIFPYQP